MKEPTRPGIRAARHSRRRRRRGSEDHLRGTQQGAVRSAPTAPNHTDHALAIAVASKRLVEGWLKLLSQGIEAGETEPLEVAHRLVPQHEHAGKKGVVRILLERRHSITAIDYVDDASGASDKALAELGRISGLDDRIRRHPANYRGGAPGRANSRLSPRARRGSRASSSGEPLRIRRRSTAA